MAKEKEASNFLWEKKVGKETYEKKKTMKLSIKEGMAASVTSGAGEAYISPFALAIGANNAQIGLLSSIPSILSPLSQIAGSRMMEKHSRRRIIFTSVLLHALMWLPIIVLGLLFFGKFSLFSLPAALVAFYSLYAIFGAIAGPAWFSLMGDLVPEKIRGVYFSRRNRICGAVALAATVLSAFLLDFFKTRGYILIGFSVLFLIACIFRIVSAFTFRRHYYPRLELNNGYYFSLWQFVKNAPYNNFGRFAIYVALMNFAAAVAGPFFAVYMLKDLNFSYATFMAVNISTSVVTLIVLPVLGKFSDKYGNRELLRSGSILIPLIPLFWMISGSPVYLILVPQVLGGLGWAAFNFSASNFIYDSVSAQRRGICVAYFNVIVGAGLFLGATLGGFLAHYLNITFMNKLLFLFLISGILRFGACLTLPMVKEVREIKKPRSHYLLYFKEFRMVREDLYSIFHSIFRLSRKPIKKAPE